MLAWSSSAARPPSSWQSTWIEIGLPILGTPADAIDEAEDRERFDELLERCKIPVRPAAPCSIWRRLWLLLMRSVCLS